MKSFMKLNRVYLLGIYLLITFKVIGQDSTKYAFVRAHVLRGYLMFEKPNDVTPLRELLDKKVIELGYHPITSRETFEEIGQKEYDRFTFWDIFYQHEMASFPQTSIIVRDNSGKIIYSDVTSKKIFGSRYDAYLSNTNRLIEKLPDSLGANNFTLAEAIEDSISAKFVLGSSHFLDFMGKYLPIYNLRKKLKKQNLEVKFTVNNLGLVSDVVIDPKLSVLLTEQETFKIIKSFWEMPIWIPRYKDGEKTSFDMVYVTGWEKTN